MPLALPHKPHSWLRDIDDIFVIQEAEHSQQLLQHINTQDPDIEFTVEELHQVGSLPFLTPWFFQVPITPLLLQSTESPHIKINIYIGTASTSLQLNIVF